MEDGIVNTRRWWTTHPTLLTASVHGLCDGNGDGLGDFKGLREKLDWFKSLGITGFRFQHIGDYGDDYEWNGLVQQDWYNVDPRYGGMEEFDRFMSACAERDMKVICMAVPEYIGWHHPDYLAAKSAREKGEPDPRVQWFEWNDDGTVLTCWDRPGPDTSNPAYMDAFLMHIGFWMDKGIAGFDTDAVITWHNLTRQTLRRFTGYVASRGGFVTSENRVLQYDVTKYGGFNAGTGFVRHEFYNELKAIRGHNADYIREALKVREQLISLGMSPYQQFGDQTYPELAYSNESHKLEMFRLQVAFNATLPDQVWMYASGIAFTSMKEPENTGPSSCGFGSLDWDAILAQEGNPDSAFACVKRLFVLRATHPELAIGDIDELETNHEKDVFAALRTSEDGGRRAVTIFNFSYEPREVVVLFGGYKLGILRNYLNGEKYDASSGSAFFCLKQFGYKLLEVLP